MSPELDDKAKPGTYGALTRSTKPWPWKRFLSVATFTPEEFAAKGPAVVIEKGDALIRAIRDWDDEQ